MFQREDERAAEAADGASTGGSMFARRQRETADGPDAAALRAVSTAAAAITAVSSSSVTRCYASAGGSGNMPMAW